MSSSLQLSKILRHYGAYTALDGIDLDLARGEFVSLLGPSGCGKSTTIRLIAGLDRPDGGEIRIDGEVVSSKDAMVPPEGRNIGMVFQSYAVWPHMTVADNVAFPLRMRKWDASRISKQVAAMLSLVGLEGFEKRYATQLSGGQQQRVALARALAPEPAILLLDEPLSNLDAKLRETMRFEIRAIQQRVGITTVYVTHSQEEALTMSDRLAVMHGGKIQQVGTPEEVYLRPSNEFVANFVGTANVFAATVTKSGDAATELTLPNGELIAISAATSPAGGTSRKLMIRPEDIVLQRDTEIGERRRPNAISGVVDKLSFNGNVIEYFVRVEGMPDPWRAQGKPHEIAQPGTPVRLTFEASTPYLLPL